jgi:hypothetical protein
MLWVMMPFMMTSIAVNIQWLGIHHDDLFQEDGTPLVPEGSLQPWAVSDEGVWKGLKSSAKHIVMHSNSL